MLFHEETKWWCVIKSTVFMGRGREEFGAAINGQSSLHYQQATISFSQYFSMKKQNNRWWLNIAVLREGRGDSFEINVLNFFRQMCSCRCRIAIAASNVICLFYLKFLHLETFSKKSENTQNGVLVQNLLFLTEKC